MTVEIIGFDADQDCSSVAEAAYAKGVRFICLYLRNLTLAQVVVLSRLDINIVSIFETAAERALQGAFAGAEDAAWAIARAKALMQPPGSAICSTYDFDEQTEQDPQCHAYGAAFKAGLDAAGYTHITYGNGGLAIEFLDLGTAKYAWMTGGMGMRENRDPVVRARMTIIQDVGDAKGLNLGIDIDTDTAYSEDYGGWMLTAEQLAAIPVPTQTLREGDTGPAVEALQQRLGVAGFPVASDGDFGPQTKAAVEAFQAAQQLTIDGIAGAQTLGTLPTLP